MNAKWLEKFTEYRKTKKGYAISRTILNEKIIRQGHLFRQDFSLNIIPPSSDPNLFFIYEAHAAKKYWSFWKKEFKEPYGFSGRKIHGKDTLNRLLDIGYHFLTGYLVTLCSELDIPTELGILHKATSRKSKPLVYDLIEWMRPLIIDETLFHFLKKKKKPIESLEKEIPKFIGSCKKKFAKHYFHKNRHNCITLEYFIKLFLLEFRGSVSKNNPPLSFSSLPCVTILAVQKSRREYLRLK